MHRPSLSSHRILGGTLVAAVVTFGVWAFVGELDIVVSAHGKLVPTQFVRISQTLEGGVVRHVAVKDGQAVRRGDLLVQLDATLNAEDRVALDKERRRLSLTLDRIAAESTGRALPVSSRDELSLAADSELAARLSALAAARAEAQANVGRLQTEIAGAARELANIEARLPLIRQQEDAYLNLRAQGFLSEFALLDKKRERMEVEGQQTAQTGKLQSLEMALRQAQVALQRVELEHRKELALEKSQTLARLNEVKAGLGKASYRESQSEVRSPVDGVVTNVARTQVGQVVPSGTTLLEVVPRDEPLMLEGWVRNEDAGFVVPGMPVKVKLAPYPFQKYGLLEGTVQWVGADSETPESMRNVAGELLFYRVRVVLNAQQLERDGKVFEARPGMQAVADIQVGRRSLFEYLTSPLKKTVLEAARER